jgi:hypothetical protein
VSPAVDQNTIASLPEHLPAAAPEFRYMRRRRVNRADRNGDPLDGVVNLFDVSIVLAVAFLLAALTGFGLSGLLSKGDMTVVTNPGSANMQVILKQGDKVQKLTLKPGQQATGVGTLIGQFYRLKDGTTVYVPSGTAAPASATPTPGPTGSPAP